jgi:hypothetical protein
MWVIAGPWEASGLVLIPTLIYLKTPSDLAELYIGLITRTGPSLCSGRFE